MRRPLATALAACLVPALLSTGCLTRFAKEDVYREGEISVSLRSEKGWGGAVEKGHDHPATIAAVRLAHVLSRIDVRMGADEGNRRSAAIPTDLLYDVAEGMARAFARASASQEIVVAITRKERRFAIFDETFLTSFLAYARGDDLVIHLSRIDWAMPERRDLELPEPRIGDHPQKFRVFTSEAMQLVDPQSVAIAWRDPVFSRPTRTKVLPTGEVLRKTILLESPAEEVPAAPGQALPPGLSPDQLRALADLEEARRNGEITEAEYRTRQRELLAQP